jgi:kynurenine formamidase
LEDLIGDAAIVDLQSIHANEAIGGDTLVRAGAHIRPREMVILKTCWDLRFGLSDPRFWTEAPYLTRDACIWLAQFEPLAVGFDFPQDQPIRGLIEGRTASLSEFVTHDVLLRNGTLLIEYLRNLYPVRNRVTICALPISIPDSDGAPARVVAIQEDD